MGFEFPLHPKERKMLMNIDQVIINSIIEYPNLYKDIDYKHSREKVLEHLFFTSGNGMDWKNGTLQYHYYKESKPNNNNKQIPKNYFENPIFSEEKDEATITRIFRLKRNKMYTPHEICDKLILELYPLSKYSALLNIPEDIKSDWLDAVLEVCNLGIDIYRDPYKHAHFHYIVEWVKKREFIKVREYVKNQLNYLRQAKERIFYIEKQTR